METKNLSIKDLNTLIGSDAYWQVNKKLARYFKCNNTALLLSDFISKQHYFGNIGQLNNGYFFNTSTNIEEDCNISYSQQKKCIESLKKVDFLETWLTGVPAKLHFKINTNKIWDFLNSSIQENQKLDLKKIEPNNNIYNNNKYNNTYISKKNTCVSADQDLNKYFEELHTGKYKPDNVDRNHNAFTFENKALNDQLDINWEALVNQFNEITKKKAKAVLPRAKRQIIHLLTNGYTKSDLVKVFTLASRDDWFKNNSNALNIDYLTREEVFTKYADI